MLYSVLWILSTQRLCSQFSFNHICKMNSRHNAALFDALIKSFWFRLFEWFLREEIRLCIRIEFDSHSYYFIFIRPVWVWERLCIVQFSLRCFASFCVCPEDIFGGIISLPSARRRPSRFSPFPKRGLLNSRPFAVDFASKKSVTPQNPFHYSSYS